MSSFAPCITKNCCLCGSDQGLTGEHKIKASALRSEFGRKRLVIGRDGERFRQAQSAGSRELHFSARVCSECNNARTQPADLAFDAFHACVMSLIHRNEDPATAFQDPRFASDGRFSKDLFRYFAKLLCCHLAEIGAPFQAEIADFAIGVNHSNCISLGVDLDPVHARDQAEYPGLPRASHGGLVVIGERESLLPSGFHSTISIGAARYKYQARFTEAGQFQLMLDNPEFVGWCRSRIEAQLLDPLSAEAKLDLGL